MQPEQVMSALQSCLVQPTHGTWPPVVSQRSIPQVREPFDVLIQVIAVALNPTDYKMPRYHPVPGAVMGCDFAGKIVEAGSHIDPQKYPVGLRVCGPVHGSNPGDPKAGAFAEYLVQDVRLLLRVPQTWNDLEAAALGGIGWATVALTMEHSLKLPGSPSSPAAPRTDGSRKSVLVYGGATATGTMACQLLKLSGYDAIATASPASAALVQKYGAAAVVPYAAPNCADIIKEKTSGNLRHAIDCITTPESMRCCFSALGRIGARYASLEHAPDEWRTRKAVKMDLPMTYVVMGKEVKLDGVYHRDADMSKFELASRWRQEVQALLDHGTLRCHPAKEIGGRWEGIIKGLDMLAAGEVRAQKLVVRIKDV